MTQTAETTVRRRARRLGYIVRKSRRTRSIDNLGGYMLIHIGTNIIVLGLRFEATLVEIDDWLCGEERQAA